MPRKKTKYSPTDWLDKFDLTDLKDLKKAIAAVQDEGKKVINHYKEIAKYYDDWQERIIKIDTAAYQMSVDTGIEKEEIYEPPSKEDLAQNSIAALLDEARRDVGYDDNDG